MAEKERNYDNEWVTFQVIAAQTLYVCFIPFFVYGIAKWSVLKQHIVIVKRFPMVSILMVSLAFLNATWWLCQAWMQYSSQLNYTQYSYNILHVRSSVALSFANNGLINLRLFLTYLRWKQNSNVSKHTETIDVSSSNQRKVTNNLYTHWFSISIILLTSFGFFCILLIMKAFVVWSIWTILMIITIILIIIFVINKVKDGIGSTNEGLVMLLIFIFVAIYKMIALYDVGDAFKYIGFIILSLVVYIQALYPLYVALYYIYKIDRTLTKTETETEMKTIDNDSDYDLSLFKFLDTNQENYTAFREYLAYMWALENLLFLERVSIFNQIVLKYKNDDDTTTINRIKFRYLQTIYQGYQHQIDVVKKDKNEFKNLKVALFGICQQIHNEFIEDDAINQVNISYESRRELMYLLQNEDKINKFQSFDDFLYIFDNAMVDIQRLLSSIYLGGFRPQFKGKK